MILIPPRYNFRNHPVPFHKAQDLGKVPKKLVAETAPDLEEAYDVSGRSNAMDTQPDFGTRMMTAFRTMTMTLRNRWMSLLVIS